MHVKRLMDGTKKQMRTLRSHAQTHKSQLSTVFCYWMMPQVGSSRQGVWFSF